MFLWRDPFKRVGALVNVMHRKPVDKYLVAIVDGNQRHREQVSEVLSSVYRVATYGDSTNALMGLRLVQPGLVLIGEQVPPSSGVTFLKAMRQERELVQTPAVFLSDNGDPTILQSAMLAGANDCLLKPYRRSALIRAISAQLNAKIEREWKALPPLQRDALESTSGIFNSIADVLDMGSPIQYMAVAESCSALVEAVSPQAVGSMLDAVKQHHNFTYAHSMRVATLLVLFGSSIGLTKSQQSLLACGGLLHDVGKLSINHALLNKIEDLTAEEWDIVRGHVAASVSFLKAAEHIPKGIITIAAHHHERLDGSGYPLGLKGPQLNDLARMAAIVDVYAAMTDHRLYKATLQPEAALKTMTDEMGAMLDQALMAKFREVVLDALVTTGRPSFRAFP